jgi:hypothetical protein
MAAEDRVQYGDKAAVVFSMKYMQSCSSVSAEIISSLSAEQSSEHTAQSSEHESSKR